MVVLITNTVLFAVQIFASAFSECLAAFIEHWVCRTQGGAVARKMPKTSLLNGLAHFTVTFWKLDDLSLMLL